MNCGSPSLARWVHARIPVSWSACGAVCLARPSAIGMAAGEMCFVFLQALRSCAASSVELQLGLAGLLDCWILGARYQTNAQWDFRVAIAGALTGGMQVPLGKRLFLRLSLDFAKAALRYRYVDPNTNETAFSTPSVFGDAGLALGMSLR